jgi:hypothetical protein
MTDSPNAGQAALPDHRARGIALTVAAVVAVLFGLLTIRSGGAVLFGGDEARRAAGAYVGFVLWFNFLAGFAYVVAGAGLWARRRWAVRLAIAIAAATLAVFVAFGVHAAIGGAWEPRTAAAMVLRTVVWAVIAWVAWRRICRTG